MEIDVAALTAQILSDIRVELGDEFDQNFARQAFFSKSWERRKGPLRKGGATLIDSGRLRKSIQSKSDASSITFFTDLVYAAIHNEGGKITVTRKMKGYFWHKYYETCNAFGRRRDGRLRKDKRTVRLTSEAEFWKWMALKKEGSTIKIPQRQFLGSSPEVEKAVEAIINENLKEYFENVDLIK